uniref:Uncharacterized protein n=1 Tax=Arundo donax TaxID=35708 RepID=A0A0A9BYL8_ARUDO
MEPIPRHLQGLISCDRNCQTIRAFSSCYCYG